MFAPTDCERHHGQRRVMRAAGDERPAAKDIDVLDVVHAAVGIQNAGLGVGTHPARADLMNEADT